MKLLPLYYVNTQQQRQHRSRHQRQQQQPFDRRYYYNTMNQLQLPYLYPFVVSSTSTFLPTSYVTTTIVRGRPEDTLIDAMILQQQQQHQLQLQQLIAASGLPSSENSGSNTCSSNGMNLDRHNNCDSDGGTRKMRRSWESSSSSSPLTLVSNMNSNATTILTGNDANDLQHHPHRHGSFMYRRQRRRRQQVLHLLEEALQIVNEVENNQRKNHYQNWMMLTATATTAATKKEDVETGFEVLEEEEEEK